MTKSLLVGLCPICYNICWGFVLVGFVTALVFIIKVIIIIELGQSYFVWNICSNLFTM